MAENMLHYDTLIERLDKANASFKRSKIPSVESLSEVKKIKSYRLWHDFDICVKNIKNDQTFQGFKLLLPSERGVLCIVVQHLHVNEILIKN